MSYVEPQMGELYLRREINTPAGTPAQRIAWAGATEPSGYHVGTVVDNSEVGFIRLAVGWESIKYGLFRISRETLHTEWEKP